jgi:hypothetical protein
MVGLGAHGERRWAGFTREALAIPMGTTTEV